MTGWKKLPLEVAYFPSPHTSKTGTVAIGEQGVSYTSRLAGKGGSPDETTRAGEAVVCGVEASSGP